MTRCPKCNQEIEPGNEECSRCGIVIKKYLSNRNELFNKAKSLFQNKELNSSKKLFIQIQSSYPELNNIVGKWIDNIDKALLNLSLKESQNEMDKAINLYNNKKYAYALYSFNNILRKYPSKELEVNKYIHNILDEQQSYSGYKITDKSKYKKGRYMIALFRDMLHINKNNIYNKIYKKTKSISKDNNSNIVNSINFFYTKIKLIFIPKIG